MTKSTSKVLDEIKPVMEKANGRKNTLLLGRADWHLLANALVILYLIAALISGLVQKSGEGGEPVWLTVHLFLLGAVTNAIITWSDHFVSALLWARSQDRRRQMTIVSILNIGIIGVLISVSHDIQWLVIVSAALIVGVISFYLRGIGTLVNKSLNKRFKGVIAFYQFAAFFVIVGIVLGVVDAPKSDTDLWQPRITLAHLHANLLGWVGLTIIGTLITLWPTVLRTQMDPGALEKAKLGLKFLVIGTVGVIAGAILDQPWLSAASLVSYLTGLIIALAPAALLLRRRLPDRSSAWMLFTGALGLVALLVADFLTFLILPSPAKILSAIETHLILVFTLWLLPVLLGALTYLLPVVLGRGPASNRQLETTLNLGWKWRLYLFPLSSVMQILPKMFHIVGFLVAAFALGVFLVLTVVAMRQARRVTASL